MNRAPLQNTIRLSVTVVALWLLSAGTPATAQIPTTSTRITNVDFRRSDEGAGRVKITLSGPAGPVNVDYRNGHVVATIADTYLPKRLEKRLDVTDFATPVKYVDVYADDGNTRIVVTPVHDTHYKRTAYQSGNQFTLELKPIKAQKATHAKKVAARYKPKFTGKRISLSLQKIGVRAVLQTIADVAGVNMVVSDNVSGNITLQLDNVPWDQALDIILRSQGLGMTRVGNVISIAPLKQMAQRRNARQAVDKAARNAAPLQSRIIQINYANAGDIANLIRNSGNGNGQAMMLSDRGQISVDKRTNSLLLTDTAARLHAIRQVIDKLDIPVRQVLIQSRIVVANRNFSRQLGVSQSVTDRGSFNSPKGGNYLANTGFTINLPVATPAGALTTSIIGSTFSLNLALSAMETENEGEIISSPRIITTDGRKAVIKQGQEVPYTTAQGIDNPATTEFKEVVLKLGVTPHITPNNHVLLNIDLTQDNVDGYSANGEPIIDTRSVQTQVLVDNGDTVVLGGIYQQKHNNRKNEVPILGDLPLIGVLFSSTARQHRKQELLIFITPKILKQTLTER